MVLNNSGDSGHPCLVPDLRSKAFSFAQLSMLLAIGFSNIAFIIAIPSKPTLLSVFNHTWSYILSKALFFFFLHLLRRSYSYKKLFG